MNGLMLLREAIPDASNLIKQNKITPILSTDYHKIPTCKEQQLLYKTHSHTVKLVEDSGIEPLTSCVQGRRSPS